MRDIYKVAIIGTREPTDIQAHLVKTKIDELDATVSVVMSGCAYGIDEYALEYAHSKGITTVGFTPWPSYNKSVQKYCHIIICLQDISPELRQAALDSVAKYHPYGVNLLSNVRNQGVVHLHARNYLIVKDTNKVIAFPKNMSGGTMQGIRIAQDLNIPLEIINACAD